MVKHSKYYYEKDRNGWTSDATGDIPEYYVGDNGYMAKDVVANFDLTYNLGTACTYILRAYRKHKTPVDCIKKAIAHLNFELEKYENAQNTSMCEAEDDQVRRMEKKTSCC